ncbi:glycosyltransferase family 25 protein [Marinobacter sp. SBS5]|uniref:glycosyltransferase family 25 protein n=1 Tax=Marinobacter sp. SBS5 TaxID=3401754 RepID=UPI003AADBB92
MKSTPIFLVSMKDDSERRERLEKSFPDFYSTMTLVEAVDGRKLSAQDYFRYASSAMENHKRILAPAEVGCSLSHIKALELFLETGAERAVILEDDVIGNDRSLAASIDDLGVIPDNALIIFGGQEGLPSRKYILGKVAGRDHLYALPRYSNAHILRTCCYGVTRSSAERILASQNESLKLADAWWAFFPTQTDGVIHFSNQLAHPEDRSESYIESSRAGLSAKGEKGFANYLKKRRLRLKRKVGAALCKLAGYKRVVT